MSMTSTSMPTSNAGIGTFESPLRLIYQADQASTRSLCDTWRGRPPATAEMPARKEQTSEPSTDRLGSSEACSTGGVYFESRPVAVVAGGNSQTQVAKIGRQHIVRTITVGSLGTISIVYSDSRKDAAVTTRYFADGTLNSIEYKGRIFRYAEACQNRGLASRAWMDDALEQLTQQEALFREAQRELKVCLRNQHVLLPNATRKQVINFSLSLNGLTELNIAHLATLIGSLAAKQIARLADSIAGGTFYDDLGASVDLPIQMGKPIVELLASMSVIKRTLFSMCLREMSAQLGALGRDPLLELLRDLAGG